MFTFANRSHTLVQSVKNFFFDKIDVQNTFALCQRRACLSANSARPTIIGYLVLLFPSLSKVISIFITSLG